MLKVVRNKEIPLPSTGASIGAARYCDRDLSQLEFLRRVLDEGLDASLPLLERLKFLAILSSNIDEFFMVRIPRLKEKREAPQSIARAGLSFAEILAEARRKTIDLTERQADCLADDVIPALHRKGIEIVDFDDLREEEKRSINTYFDEHVRPVLTAQAVDPTHPFPYITNGSINIGMFIEPELPSKVAKAFGTDHERFFVVIEVPAFLSRFVEIKDAGNRFRCVLIEQVIRANIAKMIPSAKARDCHFFRLTRDATIELRESEAVDLVATMKENLKERRFGGVERLEISASAPATMVDYLKRELEMSDEGIYLIREPISIGDFWTIVNLERNDLKCARIRTVIPAVFDSKESHFDLIKRQDILLHHPYNPYDLVTDLVRSAAEDDDVLAIKICLYRIGSESPICESLIEASERGKQVTALIEIKARFDEANNIEWCRKLEESGVHVIYGLLGLKTHAKTTLIVRKEGDELARYVHLATGNYNPGTSTIYTDLGLLTADPEIGADVSDLFNYLTVYTEPLELRKLLIAPLNLRERMTGLIEREIENANKGRSAGIIAKLNRLADPKIVNLLYAASQAGVAIDLIVRGLCTLRPGVPGLSENIRVRSIVGRLLEHSRVYFFENGGEREVFMGSSDWMPRNLDRRVEVLAPIRDRSIARYLRHEYLEAYLRDNTKARQLRPDGTYERVVRTGEAFEAQEFFQGKRTVPGDPCLVSSSRGNDL
ncbi:MAG: polyphosphate kinase 1 [Pyrinomonadaceae bacterium]